MAKHRRRWNQSIYERYLAEGRGQGEGKTYKPWIRVQDFASRGTVSRIYSAKTDRVHHLLSNNERYYFYLLEWSDRVIDIREQFPLSDVQTAMEIATGAGIKYPKDNISGFPYVMTCDFLVTTQNNIFARTLKLTDDLGNQRTIEKLEIERRYWKRLNIDWKIITEKDIPMQIAKEIEWVRSSGMDSPASEHDYLQKEVLASAKELFSKGKSPIASIANNIDTEYGLPPGTGLLLFKRLIVSRQLSAEKVFC
jgi:hypothetical protein